MKIALIQQAATPNREANREKGMKAVKEAASNGAKIICFSELAFDPFYPQIPATQKELDLAEPVPGPTTELFSELAKKLNVVIVLNLFERDGEHTFDTSPVIDADGTLLGTTRMIHITEYPCFHEQGYYHPGDHGAPVYFTKYFSMRETVESLWHMKVGEMKLLLMYINQLLIMLSISRLLNRFVRKSIVTS
jgi:N-carbamoylputrescine amidase